MSQGSNGCGSSGGSSVGLFSLSFTSPSSQMARLRVCGVFPLFSFLSPLPASFMDGRLSLSVVQQCHLAGRKFLGPLRFILFHLFYGRGWGKHNSVGTVMALSSPHQEPGNREEERECSTLMGVWMKADGWGCFHKVPAALEMQARLHFFFARLL